MRSRPTGAESRNQKTTVGEKNYVTMDESWAVMDWQEYRRICMTCWVCNGPGCTVWRAESGRTARGEGYQPATLRPNERDVPFEGTDSNASFGRRIGKTALGRCPPVISRRRRSADRPIADRPASGTWPRTSLASFGCAPTGGVLDTHVPVPLELEPERPLKLMSEKCARGGQFLRADETLAEGHGDTLRAVETANFPGSGSGRIPTCPGTASGACSRRCAKTRSAPRPSATTRWPTGWRSARCRL